MDGDISKETWRIHWENQFIKATANLCVGVCLAWKTLVVPGEATLLATIILLPVAAAALALYIFESRRAKAIWPDLEDEINALSNISGHRKAWRDRMNKAVMYYVLLGLAGASLLYFERFPLPQFSWWGALLALLLALSSAIFVHSFVYTFVVRRPD